MGSVPQPMIVVFAFAVGAVVGSFLNVVILRLPRQQSVVTPGSRCPSCGTAVRWYDNIPIVSWLLLRARCRTCQAPISLRYPIIELCGGAIGVLSLLLYGTSVAGLEAALFGWITLALGVIDLEHQLLLDVLTYPSIVLGVAFSFVGGLTTPLESILGAVIGAAIPAATIGLYKLWRGIEGMGWGDVKYLAAIGAVVGVQGCLWVLVLAAILGAAVGGVLIIARRGSMQTALPFGTFLAAAVLLWLYAPPGWRFWLVV